MTGLLALADQPTLDRLHSGPKRSACLFWDYGSLRAQG